MGRKGKKKSKKSESTSQKQKSKHDSQKSTKSQQHQQSSRSTQQAQQSRDTQQQQALQATQEALSSLSIQQQQSAHSSQEAGPSVGAQKQQSSRGIPEAGPSLGAQKQQSSRGIPEAGPSLGAQKQQSSRGIPEAGPSLGAQKQQSSRGIQQERIPHSKQQQASQSSQPARPSSLGIQQQQIPRGTQQQQTSRGTQEQQSSHDIQQAWSSRGTQQQRSPHVTQQQQSPRGMQPQQVSQGSPQAWASRVKQQQQSPHVTQQQQSPRGTQPQQVSQGTPQAWGSRATQQQQSPQDTQQAWSSRGTQQQQVSPSTSGTWASRVKQQQQSPHVTQQQQSPRGMQPQQVSQGSAHAWASRAAQQQQSPQDTQQAWSSRGTQQQQSPRGMQPQQVSPGTPEAWASRATQQQQSPHGIQPQQVSQGSPQAWGSRATQQPPHVTQQQQSPQDTQQAWSSSRGTQQQQSSHGTWQALSSPRTKQTLAHSTKKSEPKIYEDVKILVPIKSWPRDTKASWPTSPIPPEKFVAKQDKSDIKTMHLEYFNLIPLKTSRTGGQVGRKIFVETNMLKLNFPKNFQTRIIHYDVTVTPDKPKCFLRSVFEKYRKMQFPQRYPAFDGRKNAYSANDLPFGDESEELEVEIFDQEFQKKRTFRIFLKKVAVLDLSWLKSDIEKCEIDIKQRCIQALDVILRHGPAYQYITVGRSLFHPPEGKIVSLSNGLDLWIGVFQSVIIGARPYLNIDVAHKGFPTSQPVISLLKEFCKNPKSYAAPDEITAEEVERNSDKINKFLKGLKVQYELPDQPTTRRTYSVNSLVPCPRNNKFELEDGTTCTVEQYYSQTKKYKIKYYDLPCIWVGSKNTNIHVPAELCTIIAGQVLRKKMDDSQTSKMIREAATNTDRRKEKIMNGFAKMNLNHQPTVSKEFHFSVQGEFEKVPARVLQAPVLEYHQRNINVYKGTWRAEKFLNPSTLPDNSWTILNLDVYVRDPDLHNLCSKLQQCGRALNMNINRPQTPFRNLKLHHRDVRNVHEYFIEKKQQNIQLVIVILPNIDRAYSVVKQISEIHIHGGIVTQCIKQQTLRKLNDSTIGNILLKINSKLNGINHKLALSHRPPCLNVPCMIVGADVTHPSPDALNIPSIAAVAASHDPNAFQYNVEIRLQSPREEIIADLRKIMKKQLLYFYQRTGHKPRRIIFYRDGVSEGQLTQVIHSELFAIKEAIAELERTDKCTVPITFFVVQKRHHIRLFPTDKSNSDDRNFNVQAGTIVDSEITHPTQIDFYLVSHASIQGTARPTKYRCIWNENGMHEDEIEELTYYLCHLFARCTRSVSYPAPTYYAHLAAFRARALIHDVDLDITNLEKEQNDKLTLQLNENSPMFFV